MADFALWRAFDKRVLEELQVPPDMLHDQDRLRAAELRTFFRHATVLDDLQGLAPRLHQLSKLKLHKQGRIHCLMLTNLVKQLHT